MVGCEKSEPKNAVVGKVYTAESDYEYDRITFQSNNTAQFEIVFHDDGSVSKKKTFYSFLDSVIIMAYDKDITNILDTFIYHNTYLDRTHNQWHKMYYLEQ